MGDPLDVDYNAIGMVFDLYDIDNRRAEFEKLVFMFRDYIGRMTDKKNKGEPDHATLEQQYGIKSPGTS